MTDRSEPGSTPDSTPIVAVVVSAAAVAALIAFAVALKRRRASKQKATQPPTLLPIHDGSNLGKGRGDPPEARSPTSAVLAAGNGGGNSPSHRQVASVHAHMPAETAGGVVGGDSAPPSALAALAIPGALNEERAAGAVGEYGADLAGEAEASASAEKSLTGTASVATSSTADVSTHERAELAQFHQRQGASSMASEPPPAYAFGDGSAASSAADHKRSAGDIGLGHAVLAAAQELAHHCQVPGISEAATVVCIMANLVKDSRDNNSGSDSRLRQCRSFVVVLKRAEKVVAKVS